MKNCYRTKDLAESAFLYASQKKLMHTIRDNGKLWFIFEGKVLCEKLSDSFWRKEATVNAKEFADALRTLKDIVFSKEY